MKRPEHPVKRQLGFTLAEMAIVIVIVGILLTLGIGVATSQLSNVQRSATQSSLNAARDTLLAYFASSHRFPCPDTSATRTGLESKIVVGGTGTACTAAIGTIPYAAIGLPKSDAIDAYGNLITYVIDPQIDSTQPGRWLWANTLRTALPPSPPNAPPQCSLQANSLALDFGPRGELRVMKAAGGPEETYAGTVARAQADRVRAVIVLISHGQNGLGAYSPNGIPHAAPPAGSPEFANTVASLAPTPPVAPDTYNDYVYSDVAGSVFDDQIAFVTEGYTLAPTAPFAPNGATGTLISYMNRMGRSNLCN